ncbi:MAG: hypothetical protein WA874_11625 [Chryseosolibacter sp.]|jgi:hypothetical protein
METKQYLISKIVALDTDIQDWTKALIILDQNPAVKAGCLDQYLGLRRKIEDTQKLKTALVNISNQS